MKLSEWLFRNRGPYEVGLYTIILAEDPDGFTAGRVVFPADVAEARDGVVVFYCHFAGQPFGELLLIEDALKNCCQSPDGIFAAEYTNLAVPVEGFIPNVAVTVENLETKVSQKDAEECVKFCAGGRAVAFTSKLS